MRDALAVTVICLLAAVPVLRLHPLPAAPPIEQLATLSADLVWRQNARWFGGLSGLDVTNNGSVFIAVTDRGHMIRGRLVRRDGRLVGLSEVEATHLRDRHGAPFNKWFRDAEAVALDDNQSLYVAFEHAHRVLEYTAWQGNARWPAYTPAWRAMHENRGLEALAVTADGTLIAIPEAVPRGAWEALVYRRAPGHEWTQPFTLRLTEDFKPVGADIGPDGKLYLLERDFRYGGFRTQVRRFRLTRRGLSDPEILLQTPLGRHGNLEGLAVWRDADGHIRLTMVSDDNFLWVLRTQLVEYVVSEGVEALKH